MSLLSRCCMAALLSPGLFSVTAAAEESPPPPREVVHAAPLHLVALNERLRMQVPYFAVGGAPTVVSDTIPAGALVAGNLLGGLVVAGIERQRFKEAQATVRPAYKRLDEGRCLLDGGTLFMDALQPVAMHDASPVVARHVLTGKQAMDDVVPRGEERHVVAISYALTADLEYLLTTAQVAYAPAGKNGRRSQPVWNGQLTVAAPAPPLAAKTQGDIDRMLEEQSRLWADSGNDALVRAANSGDMNARREVAEKHRKHQMALKQAADPEWSLEHAALERARMWAADDCAPLREAIRGNAMQLVRLLPRVYAGGLQPFPKIGFWKMPAAPEESSDGMNIRTTGPDNWMAWPTGGVLPGRIPSSAWMPDEAASDKSRKQPDSTDG